MPAVIHSLVNKILYKLNPLLFIGTSLPTLVVFLDGPLQDSKYATGCRCY